MFVHLFTNRLKCLLRDKEMVFWTLLFPLLLATLFHFAFGNLMSGGEDFAPTPIAVVDNASYQKNTTFRDVLESISTADDRLFDLTSTTQEHAEELLKEGDIDGYITVADTIGLTVKKTGMGQSIAKAFLDEYIQTEKTFTTILQNNPAAVEQGLFDALGNRQSYTKEITLSGSDPDTMLNYFYALIAMACLYGSFWGLRNTTDIQADLSPIGARRSIAPTHKLKAVLCDELAALTLHFAEVLVVLAYLVLVLGVNFGSQLGYVVLTCFVGSVTGVSYGTFVGSVIRKKEGLKTAILVSFTMVLSFLAGLMFGNMKDIIAHNAPIVNYLNPAALIADAFYSLYVYETHTRFFLNISILCAISVVLALGSYIMVRRQKYASL